jgi:chromosome segregation ATPase
MLDTIKGLTGNGKGQKQTEELQSLIATAREERGALSAMLTQISMRSSKLAQMGKSLEQAGQRAEAAAALSEEVSKRVASLDERLTMLDRVDERLDGLVSRVDELQRVSEQLVAPDSTLETHKLAVQQLAAETVETRAALEALRQDRSTIEELRQQLQQVAGEVRQSKDGAVLVRSELDGVRARAAQLGQEYERIRDTTRGARDDAASATEAVKEIEKKLGSVTQMRELARTTEERLTALNTLAEHVSHKMKALEGQKHAIDHAAVQANRLNEMVWSMDVQINKLADSHKQVQKTEETLARMEKLAHETEAHLESAMSTRDDFSREFARLERESRTLAEYLRQNVERLSVERKEFDAFDHRLTALQNGIANAEGRMEALSARDKTVATLAQRVDAVVKDIQTVGAHADELMRKQSSLDALSERLAHLDELGRRLAVQHETLTNGRADVDQVRQELQEFHKAYADATQLGDRLSRDRAALEAFGERAAMLLARTPELDARMEAILGKMHLVEEGTKSATRLGETTAMLAEQVARVGARAQFIDAIEGRLNSLHTLVADVSRSLGEQLARRNEVDAFKNTLDGIATQALDTQQKLDGITALQQQLLPVPAEVSRLLNLVTQTQHLAKSVQQDEAGILDQQTRLSELVEQSRGLATVVGDRLKQMQGMCDELARASTVKDELLNELSVVQARQREAISQTTSAEDQLKRVDAMLRQLEQRRTQLTFTEKKMATFETRLNELRLQSESIDQKIAALSEREAVVQAVKAEVENIHEISGRSKADLNFVTEHRNEVATVRAQVEDLLSRVSDTDQRIAAIDARRKMVEDVQTRANAIGHLLGDISVNLEMLGEQKAVIDHIGEKLARLDFMVQEASSTLRALQREREVAERIEQSIKTLRTRTVNDVKSA